MNIRFADRMKDYEEGIFQVLNEKKLEREPPISNRRSI